MHTPAPWHISENDAAIDVVSTGIAEIAYIYFRDDDNEQYANARLIAAAPGLLAACQMAYRKHHMGDDRVGWEELSRTLLIALDNAMGANERVAWAESL